MYKAKRLMTYNLHFENLDARMQGEWADTDQHVSLIVSGFPQIQQTIDRIQFAVRS